jgi:hypothetical protein
VEEVPGDDGVRRVRLRVEDCAPRLERVALVRPQARETEMELDDCDLGIQLRELLEAIERAVRPRGEGGADLRLERVVICEERCRAPDLTSLIRRRARQEIPRLAVGTEAECERERRPAVAERGLGGLRRARRIAVCSQHHAGDDCNRRSRDRGDDKRDPAPR